MSTPGELWEQVGGDRERYRALLREHGHLIPLVPGEQPPPLPCGWPGLARDVEARPAVVAAELGEDIETVRALYEAMRACADEERIEEEVDERG